MPEHVDTIVVGGGQAGLSVSYHLKQRGLEHVVFEQAERVAEVWRSRWDSFTLITPNWMIRLPGAEYQGDEPDGFMPRDELVAYIEDYVAGFDPPLRFGYKVTSVEPAEAGYRVRTNQGEFSTANVVIATGMFQAPRLPAFSRNLSPDIRQLHSSEYRNPQALPDGAVLVVGSAQSGCQIAEELYQSGRKVYLSVSGAGRIPRRYRGKDATRWSEELGIANRTVDQLPSPKAKFGASLHASGKDGGHSINLHQFAGDGVVLLGHIQDAQGRRIALVPDLKENLAKADNIEADFVKLVDRYIESQGLDLPPDPQPQLADGYEADEILELDLEAAGIQSVIWATGYSFDFSLVKRPVFDEDGFPVQQRGVSEFPGLYFVGLPFLHTIKSGLLAGVGDDAAHVVSTIAERRKT